MESVQAIHQAALACAKNYKRAGAALLEILQKVDSHKVFRELGFPSLFSYAVSALKLSESQAYQFIGVARKSKEVPELKEAIQQGKLNVSAARRIVSVITPGNQESWIERAVTLPQKSLELAIAKEKPEEKIRERVRPVSGARLELKVGISTELEKKLSRIKDVLSQKIKGAASLEQALEAMAECYLEKHDPMRKAKRALSLRRVEKLKQPTQGRAAVTAAVKHEVTLRDGNRCTHTDPELGRCNQTRWLEIHHIRAVSSGGKSSADNLTTLCSSCHGKIHSDRAQLGLF